MVESAGAKLRSVRALQPRTDGQMRYTGSHVEPFGPIAAVHQAVHAIESAKPYPFVTTKEDVDRRLLASRSCSQVRRGEGGPALQRNSRLTLCRDRRRRPSRRTIALLKGGAVRLERRRSKSAHRVPSGCALSIERTGCAAAWTSCGNQGMSCTRRVPTPPSDEVTVI
jgi:hypothetical protein